MAHGAFLGGGADVKVTAYFATIDFHEDLFTYDEFALLKQNK